MVICNDPLAHLCIAHHIQSVCTHLYCPPSQLLTQMCMPRLIPVLVSSICAAVFTDHSLHVCISCIAMWPVHLHHDCFQEKGFCSFLTYAPYLSWLWFSRHIDTCLDNLDLIMHAHTCWPTKHIHLFLCSPSIVHYLSLFHIDTPCLFRYCSPFLLTWTCIFCHGFHDHISGLWLRFYHDQPFLVDWIFFSTSFLTSKERFPFVQREEKERKAFNGESEKFASKSPVLLAVKILTFSGGFSDSPLKVHIVRVEEQSVRVTSFCMNL